MPRNVRVSDGLERSIRESQLYVSLDAAFERVVTWCAERPQGSWITAEYQRAYLRLHQLGWAHSFEVWTVDGQLAGGLYGLNIGGLFSLESTFEAVPDASKTAIVAMAQHFQNVGVTLVDVRVLTPEFASMGATTIGRAEYVEWVRGISNRQVGFADAPCEPGPIPLESLALFNASL